MKPATILLVLIIIVFSCKNDSKNEHNDANIDTESTSLQGAWKLVSFFNYGKDGSIDTINSSASNRQVKIYSESKVMWGRTRVSDSLDWFGYGDYTIKNDTLLEVLDFGSKSMNNIIKEKKAFAFKIIIGEDTFSQIQIDSLGEPIYAENYIRLE